MQLSAFGSVGRAVAVLLALATVPVWTMSASAVTELSCGINSETGADWHEERSVERTGLMVYRTTATTRENDVLVAQVVTVDPGAVTANIALTALLLVGSWFLWTRAHRSRHGQSA